MEEAKERIAKALVENSSNLDLFKLGLTTLPDSIWRLTELTSLNLGANRLTTVPDSISQLTQLTSLNLGANHLTTLPDSITKLTRLTSLSIGDRLTTVPESISRLTELTSLTLNNSQLTALPDSISQLTRLTSLNLGGNRLTTLPDNISRLTQLKELNLGVNRLTTLPDSISQLTRLTSLNLGGNRLTTLPDNISRLTRLTSLSLGGTRLITLPDSITSLTRLTSLSLSVSGLTTLPDIITQLTQLTSLALNNNRLTTLPDSISQLTRLTSLHLSRNQLTTLPNSISRLTQLFFLDLGNNQLTTLPDNITRLTQLRVLHLSHNRLTTLPDSITKLTQLDGLYLRGNNLKQPPQAVCNWGLQAVQAYYSSEGLKSLRLFQRILMRLFNPPGLDKPINTSAIAQTLFMSLAGIIAFFEYQWSILWVSVFAAPFVLTRTDQTIEHSFELYHQRVERLAIKDPPKNRLVFFFKFILLGILCVGIKVYATMRGWCVAPLAALKAMPENFAFYFARCSVMDLPELLPDMDKQYAEKEQSSFSLYDLGYDFTDKHGVIKTSDINILIAGLGIGVFFIIALIFRFSVKLSALFYALPVALFLAIRIPEDDQKPAEKTSTKRNLIINGLMFSIAGLHFVPTFMNMKSNPRIVGLKEILNENQLEAWLQSNIVSLLSNVFYSPMTTIILAVVLLYKAASVLNEHTLNSTMKKKTGEIQALFDQASHLLFGLYIMYVLTIVGNHFWPIFKGFLTGLFQ